MYYETRKTIGAYEVKPGLRMPFHTRASDLSFAVTVVCEQSHPNERWHGEVSFADKTILITETHDDYATAGRAAINELALRMASVVGADR
jgi:hypothetical protein